MKFFNMSKNAINGGVTSIITDATIVALIFIVQSDVIAVVLESVGPIWDDHTLVSNSPC